MFIQISGLDASKKCQQARNDNDIELNYLKTQQRMSSQRLLWAKLAGFIGRAVFLP
jgi:hypothetical protein